MSATLNSTVHKPILEPRLKFGVFFIEGLNSLSTTYFFYYVYSLMHECHGFDALHNFLLAALVGSFYIVFAIYAGRFAQKRGYLHALQWGTAIMTISWAAECLVSSVLPVIALILTANIGMCFTWPALEALVTEGETSRRIPRLLGIYNVTFAITGAFAFFTGGAMVQHWGWNAMFLVPAAAGVIEYAVAVWIQKNVPKQNLAMLQAEEAQNEKPEPPFAKSPVAPKTFLKMAWVANPMAYLAINTIVSVIPTLAARLHVDTMISGFVCSVWMFVRSGAFVLFWLWPKWHYRFRFLAWFYFIMVTAFALILLVPNLWVLVLAQVFFGIAVGLIYYSSLFYSMDVGEAKGENGGIHEGAIGAGNCAGPAIAAGGLYVSGNLSGAAWMVVCLLLCGLGVLFWFRFFGRTKNEPQPT